MAKAKYRITAPRYIDGEYIHASPEHPAIIEVEEGGKVDAGMQPADEPQPPITPHYAKKGINKPDDAAKVFDGKKGRASDRSI